MTDHKVSPNIGLSLHAISGASEDSFNHPDFFAQTKFDSLSVFRRFITICAFVLISFGLLPCSIAADSTLGDIDGDGVVSVLDIVRLNNHAAKKASLGENQKILADVDQDGVINDADRDLLIQEILETRDPASLPLAKVRETSPSSGESDVAVTRETILYFTIPLHESTTIDTTNLTAKFGDRKLLTRAALSSDRRKATLFYLEPIPASATVTVSLDSTGLKDLINRPIDADGDGVAGGVFTTTFNTLGITALPSTGVVGRVVASEKGSAEEDIPIEGAIITVDGQEETLRAVTDANGNFTLSPAPGGSFFVHIDGRQAKGSTFPDGDYYPFVGKKWYAEAGNPQNKSGDIDDTPNQGGGTGVIYLPLVKAGSLKTVSSTQTTEITAPPLDDPALNEMMQGVKLEVPPGSLFSDDGTSGGSVGIAPVAPDRLPSPLPEGLNLPLVITVQTDGPTNFERPVPVTFPNLPDPETGETLAPGEKSALWSFNHDTGKWEIVGPMTVSEDGNFVSTDAGVGLLQPGWHGTRPGAWGEGKVCHACSKQVGEAWAEASGLAYGISLNAIKVNNMIFDEANNVTGPTRHFDSIQFKGTNGAPAGLTADQLASLFDYVGQTQNSWLSQFSTVTASLGTPELITKAIKQLEKLTQGNPGSVDWWPAVEGLVEFKPIEEKIVALDLPIRMTLLAFASFFESDEMDAASDEWKELKTKQQNLIGLIRSCLKSEQRKKEAADIANQNQDLQTTLVAQIEKELSAWGELLDKTPDLELRTSASNTTPASAPDPLPSIGKTKDKAKQWLAYLQKVRSLLVLLQKKDQSLIEDFEDLVVLMDEYFTGLNQFVAHCEEEDGDGKEDAKPIKDIYIRLQSPALDERFLSTSGFIARVLAARTPYLLSVYSVKTQTIGSVFFLSPATGSSRQIPTVPMYSDNGIDGDGDGLSDQAEGVLGTDPEAFDSDGDGMNDKAELENGTDPMINNTDPSSSKPVRTGIIGTLPVFNGVSAVDVDVDDSTMAVALGTAGIGIYDVTVATAPVRIKEYKVGGDVVSVAVGRDYAVGAAGSRGMAIVPLAVDPENLVEPLVVKLKSPVNAVTTDGSLAYAGLENGDVVVVDIASGLEITRIETDLGAIEDIDYGAGQIIARGRSSMEILSLGDEGLEKTGETSSSNWVSWTGRLRLTYVNDEIIATNLSGFQSFDISNPQSPVLKGSYTDGQLGWKHMAATGSGLGVAVNSQFNGSQGEVNVYDFRYAFAATQEDRDKTYLTMIPTPGDAMAVSIYNGFAFVADSTSGVQVINFMPYDSKGAKPTIRLESNFDLTVDLAIGKGKVDEGKRMLLKAIVSDDVMVRNVELYINGEKFATDGNYPFEFTEITPLRSVMSEFKLKARAYDTGGNYEETEEITLELFPDSVPPKIVKNFPAKNNLIAPLDKVWVRFSEPMDEVSLGGSEDVQGAVRILSAGADKVLGNGDDVQIPFTGSFNTDTDIYTLSFDAPLEPGLYQFVVENTAKDLAGNALTNPMTDVEFRVYSDDDSDEDGIPDDWEVKLGYDPLNPYSRWIASGGSIKIEDGEYDTDEDNLNDAGEIVMETMLDKPDSDGDGILDGNEDTDFDGLQDGMEIKYATDPFEVDTDGDGLDDNSEIADGTDPNRENNMPLTLVSGAASYIIDASVPVITLLGDNPMTLFKGASFQDPGAKVTDDVDFEKTVLGNGTVNSSVVGNYTITYSATDRSGKVAIPVLRNILIRLNPLGDEDADGLTNGQEEALGTNPEIADTDGDGSSDKEEVWSGSDPKDSTSIPDSGLLSVSPTNLANFYSVFGYPSAEKIFTIKTLDKVKEYVVEAPVGFEVSQNGHDFSQALTILPGNQGAVLKVVSNGRAYAALKADGSVATWGDEMSGGNSTRVADKLASGVVEVVGAESWSGAFAAIKGNGSVVTWGSDMSGGNSTAVANQIASGVVKVFTNGSAFAALKANGSVVTWGDSMNGGNSTAVVSHLASGVEEIFPIQSSSSGAFVAQKSDGTKISWGNDSVYNNGTSVTIAERIGSGAIEKIVAANGAWAALKNDGNVVVWGTSHAADVFNADLTGIIDVFPGDYGFAAIKSSGAAIAWGMPAWSISEENLALLQNDVERIMVAGDLFAARKVDGTMVWWGGQSFWNNLSAEIKADLQSGVREIRRGAMGAYAALKDDGSVVTWDSTGQSLFSNASSASVVPNLGSSSPAQPSSGGGGGSSQILSIKNYQLINGTFTFGEAKQDAINRGGHLAIISTKEEHDFLIASGILNSTGGDFYSPQNLVWIGATDSEQEGVWKWLSGETVSFSNWGLYEPSDSGGLEDCLLIQIHQYAGYWNDASSDWYCSYLLEFEASSLGAQLAFGVVSIHGNSNSLVALKDDGSVVAWSGGASGGNALPGSASTQLAAGVKEIIPSNGAFAALKNDGSVVTWGEEMSGGNSYQVAGRVTTGVEKVYFGSGVYAVKADGSVACWSNSMAISANMTSVSGLLASGVKDLFFSGSAPTGAIAALKLDGSVVTWGDEMSGGNSTSVASDLASGVVEIFPAGSGFIALKSNGSVVTWGGYGMGAGNSTSVASQLSAGVVKIVTNGSSSISAAAALKTDGSVVTWGDSMSGGDSSAVASGLSSGVVEIYANSGAFIALKSNGSVVTWGNEMTGGNSTAVASQIASGIVDIFTNGSAVAALKSNGSVVTWGSEMSGGNSTAVASQLASGVEGIFSNSQSGMGSFAALKSNGSVVTWGDQMNGGNSSAVASQLASDVVDVISNGSAYAALKSDGSVVAWGNQMGGGDPSYSIYGQPSVADELTSGVVEVLATPGRFVALKEDGSSVIWGDGMTTGNYGWASLSDPLYAGLPWVEDWARGFEKNQASDDQEPIETQIWVRINDNVPVGSISGNISLRMNGITKPSLTLIGIVLDASTDQDGDGLNNGGEGANGTDPYSQDTDGDGYSDKEEVDGGSDPLDENDLPSNNYDEMVVVAGGVLPQSSQLAGTQVGAFQIGKYEVTWGEWQEVRDWAVENGYSDLAGVGEGSGDNHPVRNVSWYDVVKWCNAKSEKEGLAPAYSTNNGTVFRAGHSDYYGPRQVINSGSNGYRLPTENEWESAARGGVSSGNFTYSGSNFLNAVAWTADNSSNATKAIGTKTANELGIHDMSGNVWEWCEDGGDAYMDAGSWIDPSSGQTVNGGMFYYYARLRGGSWNSSATHCAISYRGNVGNTFWSYQPGLAPYGYIDNTIGFRLARNVISDMAYVEGGTLLEDSELAAEEVYSFEIARTEVTWAEWKAVRDWALANGYDDMWIGDGSADNHPVRNVSWYDVVKWCNAKSEMEGLIPVYRVDGEVYRIGFTGSSDEADEDFIFEGANGYRLPTEIEWEWAAGGGVFSSNYSYSGSNTLDEVAWHVGNSQGAVVDLVGNNTTLGTWPVALKRPNELGLFDMSGNVMEWCLDSYDSYHKRVRGGGFWSNGYHGVRDRYFDGVDDRNVNIGFRVAQSVYYPENDNFSDAYVLDGIDEMDWAYSTGATAEDDEPNHYGQSAVASLWWSWTAPVDGLVRVTTFGSNFDTILGVYTGEELETLDSVVANDDSGESLRSALVFEAEAGTTYHIAVDGYKGEQGSVELSLEVLALDPQRDEDGDGLSNEQERPHGTDPYEADSDGDGYSDREEVEADTDPLDVDDKPGIEYSEGTAFGGSYAWAQGVEVAVQMPMLDDGGHWIIVSGNLPKGLILGVDSRITGVPTEAGVTDVLMGYEANTGTSETRLRIRIIPTTASGGGYTFAHLAGALWGQFSGSADASGAYTGSSDGFSGSNDSFNGSSDGGFVGSGDGMGGWIGNKDGVGTQAMFHRPGGVAVAADGTIYVSDTGNNAIRKIAPNGQVTKLSGNFLGSADGNFLGSSDGVFSGSSDGTGDDAGFKNPQGIVVDKDGNILVADRKNHAIRKVTPQGVVTTIAGSFTGSGTSGLTGSSDGSASGARFNHPSDVVVDAAGNIYVADSGNHAIRKIDSSGNVTTLAGDLGYSGYQNGTADAAMFNSPQGIAIDAAGNIIVADTTNGLIRKVTPGGVVTTIAGSLFTNNAGAAFQGSGGEAFTGSSGEGGRSGWSDKAYAYFTGSLDGFTGSSDGFTGSADGGFTGSADLGWPESLDGTGSSASFSFPTDVEIDSSGNIFVVDSGSSSIRKITPSAVVITIGNVPEGFFYFPLGIAIDADGRLIVADSGNNRMAESNTPIPNPPLSSGGGISQ